MVQLWADPYDPAQPEKLRRATSPSNLIAFYPKEAFFRQNLKNNFENLCELESGEAVCPKAASTIPNAHRIGKNVRPSENFDGTNWSPLQKTAETLR